MRQLRLSMRNANLARLLARRKSRPERSSSRSSRFRSLVRADLRMGSHPSYPPTDRSSIGSIFLQIGQDFTEFHHRLSGRHFPSSR